MGINMMRINEKIIKFGLEKYKEIIDAFSKVDVSEDSNFQEIFTHFYGLRFKSKEWLKFYFNFMQEHRYHAPSIEQTIRHIYENTGEVHFSFASKLIATIDPTKPIIDQYILWQFGYNPKKTFLQNKKEEQIKYSIDAYDRIERIYSECINDFFAKKLIREFDGKFPDNRITDIKKLDFVLWGNREGPLHSVFEYNKLLEDTKK